MPSTNTDPLLVQSTGQLQTPQQISTLPLYSDELGRLPVFGTGQANPNFEFDDWYSSLLSTEQIPPPEGSLSGSSGPSSGIENLRANNMGATPAFSMDQLLGQQQAILSDPGSTPQDIDGITLLSQAPTGFR